MDLTTMCDCPICYEQIFVGRNCVTTECGHTFHTNCLLKNTRFNGYGCPYCREKLVDEPIKVVTDISEIISDDDDMPSLITVSDDDDNIHARGDTTLSFISAQYYEPTNLVVELGGRFEQEDRIEDEEYILDGMRWLFQRANCEELDNNSIFTEPFEIWMKQMNDQRDKHNNEIDSRMNNIINELEKINALSYKDLVRSCLFEKIQSFSCSTHAHKYRQKVDSTINSVLNRLDMH